MQSTTQTTQRAVVTALVFLVSQWTSGAQAQGGAAPGAASSPKSSADASVDAPPPVAAAGAEAGAEAAPPSADTTDAATPAATAAGAGSIAPPLDLRVHPEANTGTAPTLADKSALTGDAAAPAEDPLFTSSHIRRPRLMADGVLVIDSPLTTEIQGREYLQLRRQMGGVAAYDTTAALGQFGPGTSWLQLRQQPTLILLNGRRLVSAPYFGYPSGADYVDLNQLPITLIDHVEITKGNTAALYGDGAAGGTLNFVTRRVHGLEVEVGGQSSSGFNQNEADVTLTAGLGDEKTGMTGMASYFNRQPLAATDSSWIGGRQDRTESLYGSPGSFQPQVNLEYPFPDPFCGIGQKAGHSTGERVYLPSGYGPASNFPLLPSDAQANILQLNDGSHGMTFNSVNGRVDRYESATYCASNFTGTQDLILKDERLQTYLTFWHKFTPHTEGFGELGYYRSENQNRTAPAFPVIRFAPNPSIRGFAGMNVPVWVPDDHADSPSWAPGFYSYTVGSGGTEFLVGRVAGTYAGSKTNTRQVDVARGILGIRGDLKEAGKGSVLESWDWELSGGYNKSSSLSTVSDTLMDRLATALHSCQAKSGDAGSGTLKNTTIKDRQDAGCFNPFYSAAINDPSINPLGVKVTAADRARGYFCDPNDPNSPACPKQFDLNGDGKVAGAQELSLAGTPNTAAVMDRITGEQITVQTRTLGTIDGVLRGDLLKFADGGVSFAAGSQFRRESMGVNYDSAYNQRQYGFLYGGPDVPSVGRNIAAGYVELRPRFWKGLIELQLAGRIEHFEGTGAAVNPMAGIAFRPFAASTTPPAALEWLLFRGHIGRAHQAPSLAQMHGSQVDIQTVTYTDRTVTTPHLYEGNPKLDFETYTTISGGLSWDYVGMHVGGDFWTTKIDDVIAGDNTQTLIKDCDAQFQTISVECVEQKWVPGTIALDHFESPLSNLASVKTNGVDGGVSYTLDSKRRSLGDFGTFMLGVQGTYLNSYLINSPRGLREYYRLNDGVHQVLPTFKPSGERDYSNVKTEYEAAGHRNADNFAPPLPKLRFAVPLRWMFAGHVLGFTMRYIGSYNDDSEYTIRRYGLANFNNLAIAEGEKIPAWTVFDANYGYTFGDKLWNTTVAVGVLNLLDADPPAVESPFGYEVGVHDPRGRIFYVRATGKF